MAPDTDTLVTQEERLMPLTFLVIVACTSYDVIVLVATCSPLPVLGWLPLAIPCIMLGLLNARFLLHNRPSIGLMPVALFSLLTPSVAGMWAFRTGSGAWWACTSTGLLSLVVCITFYKWFQRMFKACGTPESVDADAVVIVLGGLILKGEPVPTIANRLHIAADLWRESPERIIVVTGGPTPDGTTTEAQAMARWLQVQEGIPSSAILLETDAINTEQNMALSAKLIQEKGLSGRQACIVSSDYHLYRAITLGRRYLDNIVGVGALVPPTSLLQQWCREVLTILAKRVW